MAIGKDQKTGWACRCSRTVWVGISPWRWRDPDDRAAVLVRRPSSIRYPISRSTAAIGLAPRPSGVTHETGHPWFWTLIGVDQALHHLTGFGLSIFMAAN